MILLGHYFVAWLMLKETLFSLAYTDPLNYEYEEATATVLDEVSSENVWMKSLQEILLDAEVHCYTLMLCFRS